MMHMISCLFAARGSRIHFLWLKGWSWPRSVSGVPQETSRLGKRWWSMVLDAL